MHDATQRDNLYPFRNIYNVYKPTQTPVLRGFSFWVKNGRVRRLQGKPPHKAVCHVRMFDAADGVRNVKNVRIRYSEKLLLSYLRCNCLALNMVKTKPPEQF